MIYQLARLLKASRWLILAMILISVILQPPRIIIKNGTKKYGEEISSKYDKLISDSNLTSKDWTCLMKIDIKWLKPFSTIQIFNSSERFVNTIKLEIQLQRKNESKNYNFMPWTEKSLIKFSTLSFRHILQAVPSTRPRLGNNNQDNSIILFNITRNVQLKDLSDANRYPCHNKLIIRSFISNNLESDPSSTSVKLLPKKNIHRNYYQDYYFNHMHICTKAKVLKEFFRKLNLILKKPMGSDRIPADLSAHSNNACIKINKRQLSNPSQCKSLLGNKPQTCKKDRKVFIIFYILLSFAGACCIMLGAVQFWNHRKQSVSNLSSPPRNKVEKIRKNIPPTLHQHEMSSSLTRELNFSSQNPGRDERYSDVENTSLRVDGANDISSISVPRQKNTSKQKYATFPLCAARSRNLAPTIPELQLPKPSLVSIRRLTGFSSDESSNSCSCADQNP